MAQTKQCYNCGKSKDISAFSKRAASKDGLQNKCKECNKIDNHKFRTEINPEHHAVWQKNNYERAKELIKKYRVADKPGKIYFIKNPIGQFYIGMTEAHLSVRWLEHRVHYRQTLTGKRTPLPGLHESFDKYGIENHEVGVVVEFDEIEREDLKNYESIFIQSFRDLGVCLNKRN